MPAVYSTAQAARLTGFKSEGSVRNYARRYAAYLSPGANPPAGQPRTMNDNDLALLAYIRAKTAAGAPHTVIEAQLEAGEYQGWSWQPPEAGPVEEAPPQRTAPEPPPPAPLALLAGALTAELEARRAREEDLLQKLLEAERRAAHAEGQLAELRAAQAARAPFWRRWFRPQA